MYPVLGTGRYTSFLTKNGEIKTKRQKSISSFSLALFVEKHLLISLGICGLACALSCPLLFPITTRYILQHYNIHHTPQSHTQQ